MNLKDKNIGFCLTGSFCTFKNTILQMKELVKEEANVIPIMSYTAYKTDSKYGNAKDYIKEIEKLTKNKIINTKKEAEQICFKHIIDILIIAPCTGNTLAKLTNGICDSPVLIATKLHLRNNKPVVIGISTPDGLSTNAENIGKLLNKNNYFFVPFRQNNPITMPHSLGFDPNYIKKSLECALDREQIQPILL